jgi:hypothetical protein
VPLAGVADGAPRGSDAAADGRVRDDASLPDRVEQIILADDPVPVSDQMEQEVEHLRFHLDQLGASAQLPPCRIENVIAEGKKHVDAPGRDHAPAARSPLGRKKSRTSP